MANFVIQTLPCASCTRLMVLQSDVSVEAVVRCPNCGDRFVVAELVQRNVAKWEVISDPQSSSIRFDKEQTSETLAMQTPDPNLKETDHAEMPKDSGNELCEPDAVQTSDHVCDSECVEKSSVTIASEALKDAEHQSDLELVHDESASAVKPKGRTTDWSKLEPIMPSRNDRRRRRPSSILSVIPTVLGGLAAIPIALLLIWFVLGTDPMKVAPIVARYAPWLVPRGLRETEQDIGVIARLPESEIPSPGESGFRRFDDVLTPPSGDDVDKREPAPVSTASAETKLELVSPLLTAITEHEDEPERVPVVVLLNKVQSGLNAWRGRTEDKTEQRKIAKDLYSNMSELAVATQNRSVPALQSIGTSVIQQADVCELINQGARHWYSQRKSGIVGMAICCEIQDIEKVNGQWIVRGVTTGKTQTPVQIHLSGADMASPKLGAVTFVLGIAQQPSDEHGEKKVETTPKSMTIDAHYMQSLPSRPSKLTQVGISNDRRK